MRVLAIELNAGQPRSGAPRISPFAHCKEKVQCHEFAPRYYVHNVEGALLDEVHDGARHALKAKLLFSFASYRESRAEARSLHGIRARCNRHRPS
jgi:hypothetical protein